MNPPLIHSRSGRSLTAVLVVLAIWLALLAAWLWLDAAAWILLLVAVFTLPALYDLIMNPSAGCTLDDIDMTWHSGNRSVTLAVDEIDNIRLDTRLDMTVRATAILKTGHKIRMPFESTPPHMAFESALEARGIRVKRFHFQFFQ